MLINSEEDIKESDGEKCFLYLLKSRKLNNLDFSCPRFNKLLQHQIDECNIFGTTTLIRLAMFNPTLLGNKWAEAIIENHIGK